ncbi:MULTISPECIES: AAA family ATPase [unclassified Paenibacillus]|uniref:AAA family ATPase n=1 Tax=unclassified Paenibacillus TaxID=185978 RepID=UPI00363C8164
MRQKDDIELRELLDGTIEVSSFIYIAIAMVDLVYGLHKKETVIRDLNPAGIQIRHTDAYQAILVDGRKLNYAYLSPEQTGRMNLTPDKRSDLYALGVMFYEMLAGRMPFQAQNAEEWVHAHLAMPPIPLDRLRPEVTGSISDIVMKLLAKAPEDRYQSAYGLLADLRKCASLNGNSGGIIRFEIGLVDEVGRFRLPGTLLGRTAEQEQLRDAYELARAGASAFVFVTGREGSGKTALIRELQTAVFREGGHFIEGKCDFMNRETPFAPVLQACRELARQMLRETPERVAQWTNRLHDALGTNLGVIAELIPEASALLGEVSAVDQLPPAEATARFRQLFPAFIQTFAEKEYPLVIFLDDLQWADAATVEVLRVLLQDASLYGLLILGAYQIEQEPIWGESGFDHTAAVAAIRSSLSLREVDTHPVMRHIRINPLPYVEVVRFVSVVLHEDTERTRQLADLLYQKTGGYPLYMHRSLEGLYREKKLFFDTEQAVWTWDAAAIREMPEYGDALRLIAAHIHTLPMGTVRLLGIAGAIGYNFRISTVAMIGGHTVQEAIELLRAAVDQGLVRCELNQDDHTVENAYRYSFLHDRVQQAAYDTTPASEKAGLHLQIGRTMLRQAVLDEEELIFDIVHHLNLGLDEITNEIEKRQLAEYNLRAGMKSKSTTAYATAKHFLETGLQLLGSDIEAKDALVTQLMMELSECEYMCGRADRAEELLGQLMNRSVDLVERSSIYLIRIGMNTYLKRNTAAVAIGLEALKEYGWEIPIEPSRSFMAGELARTHWALYRKRDVLPHLPLNTDPLYKSFSDIIMAIAAPAFIDNAELSGVLYSRFVRYGLKRGNNEAFAFMLGAYGTLLTFGLKRYSAGCRLAEIAYELAAPFESKVLRCRLHFVMGLIGQYRSPGEVIANMDQAVRYGLESGDMMFTGYAMSLRILNHTGDLHSLSACISQYEVSWHLLDEVTLMVFRIARWHMAKLQGAPVEVEVEVDEFEDWVQGNPTNETQKNQAYYYCVCHIEAAYLSGCYQEALEWIDRSNKLNGFHQGPLMVRKQQLYHSLSLASLYSEIELTGNKRKGVLSVMTKHLRAMKKEFGGFSQKSSDYILIEAEVERINGNKAAAAEKYEHALTAAREEGNLWMEAIAGERAVVYYRAIGMLSTADALLVDAYNAYSRWGASAKVRKLQAEYSEQLALVASAAYRESAAATHGKEEYQLGAGQRWMSANSGTAVEAFHLNEGTRESELFRNLDETVMRQAAGWPGVGNRQRLTERFLESALRSAGAEKGYVINLSGESFNIEASSNQESVGESAAMFATSLVHYVVRTGKAVVLTDASQSLYAADPYIRKQQSRSILCMPIPYPGIRLPKVLYLENNLAFGIFAEERLAVLDMLFSRMVYLQSLEDSRGKPDVVEEVGNVQEISSAKAVLPMLDPLTNREMEMLKALASGFSNKEIAESFGLTEGTVKNHMFNMYGKLDVKRRAQAIVRARELGLLE